MNINSKFKNEIIENMIIKRMGRQVNESFTQMFDYIAGRRGRLASTREAVQDNAETDEQISKMFEEELIF